MHRGETWDWRKEISPAGKIFIQLSHSCEGKCEARYKNIRGATDLSFQSAFNMRNTVDKSVLFRAWVVIVTVDYSAD